MKVMNKLLSFLGFSKCYNCGKYVFTPYWNLVAESSDPDEAYKAPFCQKCFYNIVQDYSF